MTKQKINDTQRELIAFKATTSATLTVAAANTDLIMGSELYDYGSCYNPTTGVFTAPYEGLYSFSLVLYTESAATARFYIAPVITGTSDIATTQIFDLSATQLRTVNAQVTGKMAANATIKFQGYSSTSVNLNNIRTYIAGTMLARLS